MPMMLMMPMMPMGCDRHREAPLAGCVDCGAEAAIEAALRATPMIEPPASLRGRVRALLPAAPDPLVDMLGPAPPVEPPADLGARVLAAIADDDAALDAWLRAVPMVDPPVDLRARVLAELACEDGQRRGALWRAVAGGCAAAAAAAYVLIDPAGLGTAWAGMLDRAEAWLPAGDAALEPALPRVSGPVVEALDAAQAALGGPVAGINESLGSLGSLGVVSLVATTAAVVLLNGLAARWMSRRA